VLTVASNASGGVAGKMVSPQSIAVAAAATGLVGQEAVLFRRTIKHSLILVSVVMVLTFLQSNILSWMVPDATMAAKVAAKDANTMRATIVLAFGMFATLAIAAASRSRAFPADAPASAE